MKFCGSSKSFKTGRNWRRFELFWIFDILRVQHFLNFQNPSTLTTQTDDFKFIWITQTIKNFLSNLSINFSIKTPSTHHGIFSNNLVVSIKHHALTGHALRLFHIIDNLSFFNFIKTFLYLGQVIKLYALFSDCFYFESILEKTLMCTKKSQMKFEERKVKKFAPFFVRKVCWIHLGIIKHRTTYIAISEIVPFL